MRKHLGLLVAILLVTTCALAGDKSKLKTIPFFQAHAQAGQAGSDASGQDSAKNVVISDGDSGVAVNVVASYDTERFVELVIIVANNSAQPQVFAPSQIVLLLPNGDTYRPFTRQDMLEQIAAARDNRGTAVYNPPPRTMSYNSNCSVSGDWANCTTTGQESTQSAANRAGYNVGFALGELIRQHRVKKEFQRYKDEIEQKYMVSQTITPGASVRGSLSIYVEDAHSGPFTFMVPVGAKTSKFVFGPEIVETTTSDGVRK